MDQEPPKQGNNEPEIKPEIGSTSPAETAPLPPLNQPVVTEPSVSSGRPKRRWLLPAAVIALIIILGGGYVFGMYLPNKPNNVYSKSLSNSGKALDKLVTYSNQQQKVGYKSYSFNGALKVTSASVSFDANLNGAFDDKANGTVNVTANVLGKKVTADVRSLVTKGNSTPDLYVRVSGIKDYLDNYGLTNFSNLDGQWIAIDHTLLDTYLAQAKQSGSNSSGNGISTPAPEQTNDALTRIQNVNKEYLFTTDSNKAVLKDSKYIGKETKNGRTLFHYTVGYDKTHLEAYVAALKTAADGSKLNDWAKKVYDGKNLSEVFDLKSLQDSVKATNGNYRFDLWADTKTKLVQSIKFNDPNQKNTSLTIAQNYTGGSTYPFCLSVDGSDGKGSLNINLDTKTNKITGTIAATSSGSTITGDFSATPGNNSVSVTAPSGAKPFVDILNELGSGGTTGDATNTSASPSESDMFTLQQ